MESREEINAVLAEMGEPPLGQADRVVSNGGVHGSIADPERRIELVDPPGYKRSDIVFMNGRRVIVDLELGALAAAVRDFSEDSERDYMELPTIDVVGENQASAVVVRNDMLVSRRSVELISTMGNYWTVHVPGRKMTDAAVDVGHAAAAAVAELRQNADAGKRYKVLLGKDGRG